MSLNCGADYQYINTKEITVITLHYVIHTIIKYKLTINIYIYIEHLHDYSCKHDHIKADVHSYNTSAYNVKTYV